ncbi:hypothetical protein [Piscinibacter sp. XHJ-5]|uniref:hypothetical protein n=1 Tax=Piscinibacter sp. XHJ-5 TaxID=3037797 RepID=UPI002452DF63|nr:hypothetical protein [Piscinibacter sp. XHJ-5]
MNVAPIAVPGTTLDAVLSAWADAAVQEPQPADAQALPAAPGNDGPELAGMQTLARPPVSADAATRSHDGAVPAAAAGLGDFALPESQLVPAALVGLQVEPAWGWPLPGRADARTSIPQAPTCERQPSDDDAAPDTQEHAEEQAQDDAPPAAEPCELVLEDAGEGGWCEALTRALRVALAARIPAQALVVAAEQWRRGRCVVLACPQGADPAGPAWAFVLWPRPGAALSLVGLRVEARLQWALPPVGAHWCHVRVVKEHHPRRGRQLIAPDSTASVPCEVQLGPVLARSLHWCEVCLRIDAVRRFWAALGAQWSVHVVVCATPLAGVRVPPLEGEPC